MRIPLTRYGLPQAAVFPAAAVVLMAVTGLAGSVLPAAVTVSAEIILLLLFIWIISFFRDPHRVTPEENDILFSPADGKVTDVEQVETDEFEGPVLRIGIFLSIFNVHINRSPCRAAVESVVYRPGEYRNAMSAESGRVNESNDIVMVREQEPRHRLMVRQISGAIARRIVCEAEEGTELYAGQKFGMIKFGSRTELYAPAGEGVEILAEPGDKVKAGLSGLVRYETAREQS